MATEGKTFVPRVTQLDAFELDNEVMRVLKNQLLNAGKHFEIGLLGRWEPELDALLATLVWKLSVGRKNATFGQQLLGVELDRNRALLLGVAMIAPRYLAVRGGDLAHIFGGERFALPVKSALHWLDTVLRMLSLANLVFFLRGGRHATLPHRLLGLTLVNTANAARGGLGFSFMLRELLWHGFTELLVFSLPLVNWHWLRRRLHWPITASASSVVANSKCPVCAEPPVLPQVAGCGHTYCYYCIHSHHLADPGFECVICGFADENPESIRPWKPRIL